eukprot:CAMPEP_0170336910 /NCGR_PEP_ID=MMETSP0116_2-20130129/69499_1 /TAXON_ID=400756 /ORGANISM="Durinskia baltica, Strain CSIRO CS-38" /LENGTH=47 /DNA_ID= /DNA_START= /DNA_END= /DNA_ORIENTATION=
MGRSPLDFMGSGGAALSQPLLSTADPRLVARPQCGGGGRTCTPKQMQ